MQCYGMKSTAEGDTLSATYLVSMRLSGRFLFIPINAPHNRRGACHSAWLDYRPLPEVSASVLSRQQDRRPASADYHGYQHHGQRRA